MAKPPFAEAWEREQRNPLSKNLYLLLFFVVFTGKLKESQ
jgi:hypothetical protein